jgi:hypothetical protein
LLLSCFDDGLSDVPSRIRPPPPDQSRSRFESTAVTPLTRWLLGERLGLVEQDHVDVPHPPKAAGPTRIPFQTARVEIRWREVWPAEGVGTGITSTETVRITPDRRSTISHDRDAAAIAT